MAAFSESGGGKVKIEVGPGRAGLSESTPATCMRSKMYRGIPIYKYSNGALKSHKEEHWMRDA